MSLVLDIGQIVITDKENNMSVLAQLFNGFSKSVLICWTRVAVFKSITGEEYDIYIMVIRQIDNLL